MTLTLGDGVPLDLEKLIDTRCLVQANSGGGKSWAVRRLLEQTHGRVQHLVIDPEGEFATLREHFDYVLAARQQGDTVADPRSAKLLAERLLELGVSAILDIYELKAHERIRFVRGFLEALVDAPKRLWHPVLVVVDEAHVYCPQQGEAESAAAVIDLATRGRKRGFCAVLATQRLSKLHKDAAAELNNKLIGRTGLDVDVKRAADELGFGKERWRELRELPAGDFFAFGPALTAEVRRIRVGPVRTTHPKAGARIAFTPPPPTAKVKALLPKLADLPAEAEERTKSLAEAHQELAVLRRQLTLAQRGAPLPPKEKVVEVVRRVEVPVLKEGQLARLEKVAERLLGASEEAGEAGRILRAQMTAFASKGAHPMSPRLSPATPSPKRSSRDSGTRYVTEPVPQLSPENTHIDPSLSGPEQRILNALLWLEQIGNGTPAQAAAAFLAGYRVGGGAFNNPRGSLRTKGLIDYPGSGTMRLTEVGRQLAVAPDVPLTTDELHRRVLDRLPGPEQRLLRPLLDAYPESLSNAELAEAAGYSGGGGAFNNPRGRLRSLGLIDYPQQGRCVARSLLFLEGE